MTKTIIIGQNTYEPANLISKDVLDGGGFTQKLECSSSQHLCLSDGTRKLILEVLGDKNNPENFKIYDIK